MKVELVEAQAKFPYVTVLADQDGGAIFATDSLSFVESRFPATVEEEGICQIGKMFDSLLGNVRDDKVTLATTETMLTIRGDRGLKGRLQMVAGEAAPRDIIVDKMNNTLIDVDMVVLKADMMALIQLSKLLPPTGASAPWLTIRVTKDAVIGSTPGSELGGIEEMPFQVVSMDLEVEELTVKIFIPRIEKFVSLCDNECELRTALDPKIPLIIRDPHSPEWWAMTARGA
jgi:hypothetical protein